MNLPIVYIGFAQALFTSLIFFLKRPLRIADVILGFWLIAISGMFGLNIFQECNQVKEDMWFFSLSISITFPPFLYLYSKYLTVEFEQFKRSDLLHAIPLLLLVQLILIFRNSRAVDLTLEKSDSVQLYWLRNYFGAFYILILLIYGVLALIHVFRYKKQIKDNYSYHSDKISLNWLLVVVISFLITQILIVLLSMLHEINVIVQDVDFIRNGILLVYVYVIGIWGYRQSGLSSGLKPIRLKRKIAVKNESTPGKYQKSGLKSTQKEEYAQKLILFMNRTESWKDPELTIAKMSTHTSIPKHYITQVLNESLGKNFYVFVNEYRIEYAKRLLVSSEYVAWSIVAIAYECGFNSKTAFNTFFKKYTGITPSEYKKGVKDNSY
ncbi:helix-turn-helix domain-containing protein [Maribellus maritimus]|uniref:helix-turn-helix domain-containing protein n=1 Tax=Maribellus maritimus TaxID=2870838 RepID=UPI001EEACCF2|nr:AraC family transcriptional regulator [Maribellus maritimus]MCG6190358.1 AraC family transcriptional regulator [Maribellus maritimus]